MNMRFSPIARRRAALRTNMRARVPYSLVAAKFVAAVFIALERIEFIDARIALFLPAM